MNELNVSQKKLFDDLRHVDENGNEYWLARELQTALQYVKRENFHKVIKTAQIACKISQQEAYHFPEVRKTIAMPKGASKKVTDYKLTRYACYLIVMNGDPRKDVIAWGQTYFAVKTRQLELAELYEQLSEEKNVCLSAATLSRKICCLPKPRKKRVSSLLWNMLFSKTRAIADSTAA